MAKMIKCPTCSTQIEVPPPPPGGGPQVIKCPGCGKGLKIVAKKPPSPGMGLAPGVSNGAMGGSMAGTVAGGSVSAMSFHGEPPVKDEVPSLDTNCEVCGRMTPADDLIEDNGRMVCMDCIKGARSKIDRPEEAPELLDFKRPLPTARRGRLIRVTPSLVGFCVAGLIYLGCSIYLNLIEPPRGKGVANASPVGTNLPPMPATRPGALPGETLDPGPATTQSVSTETTDPTSTQPAVPAEPGAVAVGPGVAADPTLPAPPPANAQPASQPGGEYLPSDVTLLPGESPTTAPVVKRNGSIFDSEDPPPANGTTPGIAPNPQVADGPNAARPMLPANDPLRRGIEKLQVRDSATGKVDYQGAFMILNEEARRKYRVMGRITDQLSPEQQMVLVGIASANIGRGQPAAAMLQLTPVLGTPNGGGQNATPAKGQRTRSAVLNYAIAVMSKRSPAAEVRYAITMLSDYLVNSRDDEYAADVFGTLLDRAARDYPNDAKELQRFVMQLDSYVNNLAAASPEHVNHLKWGVEWKDKALVMQYRASRGRGPVVQTPQQLQEELESAKAKVLQLKQAVDNARAAGGDVFGAQNQYRDALASLADVQMRIEQAAAPAPKAKWLEKFEPVVPEGMAVAQ